MVDDDGLKAREDLSTYIEILAGKYHVSAWKLMLINNGFYYILNKYS